MNLISRFLRQHVMPKRMQICAVLISVMLTGSARAGGVIPGRWEKVDLLLSGTPIVISLNTGERLSCTYISSDREWLLVVEIQGDQRRIHKYSVDRVIAEKYDDRLVNGAILGLVLGVGSAVSLATIPRGMSRNDRVTYGVYGTVLFGLAGMSAGALLDRTHQGRELLYEAPPKK
jgi:hypothetical protein